MRNVRIPIYPRILFSTSFHSLPIHHPIATRLYSSSKSKSRPPSKLGPTVSLDHFLQRSKALSLYRRILRDCRRIPDETSREETRRFVREDFERNRGVVDLSQIKYLIGTGKTQWEGMERYITGL